VTASLVHGAHGLEHCHTVTDTVTVASSALPIYVRRVSGNQLANCAMLQAAQQVWGLWGLPKACPPAPSSTVGYSTARREHTVMGLLLPRRPTAPYCEGASAGHGAQRVWRSVRNA
jgi:hypothetical protein